MTRFIPLLACALIFSSCGNKKPSGQALETASDSVETRQPEKMIVTHTDTLQFIHFEGNFDYWYNIFLNASKDTISLVTDSAIDDRFKNTLFEVKWFADTLYEAGDNDSKYTANRMSHFRPLKGKPFVAPITEEQILRDIRNIPEVRSGADQAGIAERPSEGKNYYLVETGSREEDNFSRFMMFRVYIYPHYEIKVYDPAQDTDFSLEAWRKLSASVSP
ncbi:hypothetical protein [Pedobacter deserti]|uniref:hypothetical protein n=1 Tax=Pedobacter deserti TaxID=2817382 RepID=UPI00210C2BD0|nr:hypothetical protein [Pedobacter sp. SYSU D00382]